MLTKAPFKTSSRNGLKDFGPCFAAQRCGDVIVARRAAAMTRDPACAIQMAHQCRVIAKVIPVSHKKKILMEGGPEHADSDGLDCGESSDGGGPDHADGDGPECGSAESRASSSDSAATSLERRSPSPNSNCESSSGPGSASEGGGLSSGTRTPRSRTSSSNTSSSSTSSSTCLKCLPGIPVA